MTSPENGPLVDYRRAAANLRGSLRRNRWDSIFSNRPGTRIHYIFDTNVFLSHANLEDNHNDREDLAALLGASPDDPFLSAMERLTADYMFSGHLPAQENEPAYLSTPHFDEVVEKTRQIERSLSGRISNVTPSVTAKIRELLALDRAGAQERFTQLQKLIPGAWLASLRASAHLKDVLQKSFLAEPPAVMPLHHVSWGWEAERPLRSELDLWRRALGDLGGSRDKNLDNDARTIATIVDLYRNDASSRFDGRRTLYLFVTHDTAVGRVVGERISDLRAEGIPYFVRSPRDFLPILNIRSMGNVYGPTPGAKNRDALREVFQRLTVALDWIEFDPSQVDSASLLSPLEELQSAWRDVSETSTFLNARYFERSNKELFEGLTEFVSEAYDDSVQSLRNTIDEVRATHVTAVLDNALAAAAVANLGEQAHGRRAQLKLIGPLLFDGLIEHRESIGDFLDRSIAKGTLDRNVARQISKNPGRSKVAMLVACLFLSAEDWDAAADFAAQAVGKMEDKAPLVATAEAAYLRALCLRFAMRSERDFLKARRQLERNLSQYRTVPQSVDNYWRSIRDRLERATLYLSSSVMQAVAEYNRVIEPKSSSKVDYVPSGHEHEYFMSGISDSEHCLNALYEDLSEHERKGSRYGILYSSLVVQALTNIAGACIFASALPVLGGAPKISPQKILELLRRAIEDANSDERPLRDSQPIYALLLKGLLSGEPIGRTAEGLEALTRIQSLLAANPRRPMNDKLRYEFLASWLQNTRALPIA